MIEVDVQSIRAEINKISHEIDNFEPYSKNFISDSVNSLEGFNSDFISKMKEALNNMKDTVAPKLLENIKTYCNDCGALADSFEETDENLAKSTGGN